MTTTEPSEWGCLFAEGLVQSDAARPLVCLVDVLRHLMASAPLRPAIERMRSHLADHHGLKLFELQPATWAAPVTDARVWRQGQEAGARWQHPRAADGRRMLSYGLGKAPDPVMEEVPAVTELRGIAGVLEALRQWGPQAVSADQMAVHPVLRVAMLATDAAALFGLGELTPPASAVSPTSAVRLQLVKAEPVEVMPEPVCSVEGSAPDALKVVDPAVWKDAQGKWLPSALCEWRKLRSEGVADGDIARRFGVSRSVITGKLPSRSAAKAISNGLPVSSKAARR